MNYAKTSRGQYTYHHRRALDALGIEIQVRGYPAIL
jgi:hypothetical protein